jgi:hypothetical protein
MEDKLNETDIVGLLVGSSFYETAMSVCILFNMDKNIIFETLTKNCCLSQLSTSPFMFEIFTNFKFKQSF